MYWIDLTANCVGGQKEFYCDTPQDVENMPTSSKEGVVQEDNSSAHKKCAKGSSVYCIGKYLLIMVMLSIIVNTIIFM